MMMKTIDAVNGDRDYNDEYNYLFSALFTDACGPAGRRIIFGLD